VTRLRGQAGYRLRVGSWRALFVIDDQRRELTVTAIGPRKNIYRR
jgi:mRNA interferase RelE/StbE